MAIRVEHQPSPVAVGLGAYSSGRGAAKERQQKYALNLFQQDADIRARREQQFQGFKYAEALQQRQRDWNVQDDVTRQSARDAELQQRRQWQVQDAGAQDARRGARAQAMGLPEIPEYVTDVSQRRALSKLRSGIGAMAESIDLNDPAAVQAYQDAIADYESMLGAIPKPSRSQAMNDDTVHYDQATGAFSDQPGTGTIPWSISQNGPLYDDRQQQAAAEKQRQAAADKYAAADREYKRQVIAEARDIMPDNETDYTKYLDKAKEQLAKAGISEPSPPAAGGDAKPQLQVDPVTGSAKPVSGQAATAPQQPEAQPAAASPASPNRQPGPQGSPQDDSYDPANDPSRPHYQDDPPLRLTGGQPAPQAPLGRDEKLYAPGAFTNDLYEEPAATVDAKAADLAQRQERVQANAAARAGARAQRSGLVSRQCERTDAARQAQQTGVVQVTSDDEYNQLPSGAIFIGPDGQRRRKP